MSNKEMDGNHYKAGPRSPLPSREERSDFIKLLGFVKHSINYANQPFDSSLLSKTDARSMLEYWERFLEVPQTDERDL